MKSKWIRLNILSLTFAFSLNVYAQTITAIPNPLAVKSTDQVIEVTDFKQFIARLIQCDTLRNTVMYNGKAVDATVWIKADVNSFCKIAIKPSSETKIGICNLSKEEKNILFTDENIRAILAYDSQKDSFTKVMPILKPIVDCYRASSSSGSIGVINTGQPQTTTITNESYGEMLR